MYFTTQQKRIQQKKSPPEILLAGSFKKKTVRGASRSVQSLLPQRCGWLQQYQALPQFLCL